MRQTKKMSPTNINKATSKINKSKQKSSKKDSFTKFSSLTSSAVMVFLRFSSAYSGNFSQKQSSHRFSSHPIMWLKSSLLPHFEHLNLKGQNALLNMTITRMQRATEHQSSHSGSWNWSLRAISTWSTSITTARRIVAFLLPSEWALCVCPESASR